MKSQVLYWRLDHTREYPEEHLIGTTTDLIYYPEPLDKHYYFKKYYDSHVMTSVLVGRKYK